MLNTLFKRKDAKAQRGLGGVRVLYTPLDPISKGECCLCERFFAFGVEGVGLIRLPRRLRLLAMTGGGCEYHA